MQPTLDQLRQALREHLEDMAGRGSDPFDKLMHQAAAENIRTCQETAEGVVQYVLRAIQNVARCPNPTLRKIQFKIWHRIVLEIGTTCQDIARLIEEELKS